MADIHVALPESVEGSMPARPGGGGGVAANMKFTPSKKQPRRFGKKNTIGFRQTAGGAARVAAAAPKRPRPKKVARKR